MISHEDAYRWLEAVEKPDLPDNIVLDLFELLNSDLPEARRDRLAIDLRVACQNLSDLNARLYVLTTLGYYFLKKKEYQQAEQSFVDALRDMGEYSHEIGVTKWLLGMALWNTARNFAAHTQWVKAREAFGKCQEVWRNKQDPQTRVEDAKKNLWYGTVIQRMKVDMACKAEEAHAWLNYFQPSSLPDSARALASRIAEDIHHRKLVEAYEFARLLSGITRNRIEPSETAEAWEIIGLAAHQMGNNREAAVFWKRSLSTYTPATHQSAVIKWMIGVALWGLIGEQDSAMKSWQDAIDMFEYLLQQANRANNREQSDWYLDHIEVMKASLKMMREEKLGL